MRSPENVLKSLSEKAKNKEYRYERLYRNLYNPEFYLLAYQNIATSQGSMTAGADGFTLDGMSMERIEKLIQKLRDHSYQPNPARRVYIAKKNSSKKRPLGIPSTDDKLLQEVVRMILEAIYEPTFSDNSHGFRPKRSCHTALKEIVTLFTGAKWIIEGDIKACFDSFDHHITIQLLRKRIKDEAFISLMWKFLRAGYMEQWTYHETYSGSPQGSGVSPILANIYLNELDEFMARMKKSFDKGDTRSRKVHKDHDKVRWAYRKAQKNLEIERTEANLAAFKEARKVMLSTPHLDEMDENYKRLQYNRYADDFLISITGSKQDAENIKEQVKIFLKDKLNLTMSEEKTHVTHSSEKVRYLGYDIRISRSQDTKRTKKGLQRVWYGKVQLYMPKEKWIAKLHEYGAFKIKKDENGKEIWKPLHRGALMPLDDVAIISKYNSEIRPLCRDSVLFYKSCLVRGSIFCGEGNIDSAIYYTKKAARSNYIYTKTSAYENLYAMTGDSVYLGLYRSLCDSIAGMVKPAKVNSAFYGELINNMNVEYSRRIHDRTLLSIVCTAVVVVLVSIFLFYFFRRKIIPNKQHIEVEEENNRETSTEIEKRTEALQREIVERIGEITAQKNKRFVKSEFFKEVTEYIEGGNVFLTISLRDRLFKSLRQEYALLYQLLTAYFSFSDEEFYFFCLSSLGLNTKECAACRSVSVSAIRVLRKRINDKMHKYITVEELFQEIKL